MNSHQEHLNITSGSRDISRMPDDILKGEETLKVLK